MEGVMLPNANPLDFRFLDEGLGGTAENKKRRRDEEAAAYQTDDMAVETRDGEGEGLPLSTGGVAKRLKSADGKPVAANVGKESGRSWKDVRTHRASRMRTAANYRPVKTQEDREREKALTKAYRERKEELKEEIRSSKRQRRQRLDDKKKKRDEGHLKGSKIQIISNPKTLKKMSKKQLRQLVKV